MAHGTPSGNQAHLDRAGMMDEERRGSADDWDVHWDRYGAAASRNPANEYRHHLIMSLVGRPDARSRILDIGSGQGELALLLGKTFPEAEVRGLEYSETGVRRSRQAAQAMGIRATFGQRDLLQSRPVPAEEQRWATIAICSEVLEHLDEPERLLRNVAPYLAPDCRVIVTVPGGPRTAFDRHIGHRRHYSATRLRTTLETSGLTVQRVFRAGFPFFNLYKLAVWARGRALIADLDRTDAKPPPRLVEATTAFFETTFRWNLRSCPLGWQLVATGIAHGQTGER